jgi:16S rRNA (guanine1207-N2)-methyltransferase
MVDNEQTAIASAVKNLAVNGAQGVQVIASDGSREIHEANFTQILCNPPYYADFSVPKEFIVKGFNRLAAGGTMHLVTRA